MFGCLTILLFCFFVCLVGWFGWFLVLVCFFNQENADNNRTAANTEETELLSCGQSTGHEIKFVFPSFIIVHWVASGN